MWQIMRYALCVMRYALCVMRYALCVMRYALCVMRYALCVMREVRELRKVSPRGETFLFVKGKKRRFTLLIFLVREEQHYNFVAL